MAKKIKQVYYDCDITTHLLPYVANRYDDFFDLYTTTVFMAPVKQIKRKVVCGISLEKQYD